MRPQPCDELAQPWRPGPRYSVVASTGIREACNIRTDGTSVFFVAPMTVSCLLLGVLLESILHFVDLPPLLPLLPEPLGFGILSGLQDDLGHIDGSLMVGETAAVWVWRLCQPDLQQPRIRSVDIACLPCCAELMAGSMVPIALTIKMIKRPNACSPRT